jgi:L-asparaginase II
MLAAAQARGFPTAGYHRRGHPLQEEIIAHVSAFTGVPAEEIGIGIDGCSVPCFALPLERMALAFARLGAGRVEPADRARAAARIRDAMTAHPDLVAGSGRTSTELMLEFPGRVLSKGGAQGVLCGALLREGLGFAIKMADGFGENRTLAALRLLEELDLDGVSESLRRAARHATEQTNRKGERVGTIEATFALARAAGAA